MSLHKRSYLAQFPHGLMFHRFHDHRSSPAGQGSLTPSEFEDILHFVGIENILSPEDWLFRLRNDSLREKDLCITLDDGLKCQYDICLPVLKKYNVRAFWFIYSSVFEGKVVESEVYNCFAAKFFTNIDEFFELFFGECGESILKRLNEDQFKRYSRETRALSPFYSDNDLKFRFIRNELLTREQIENIMDKIMEARGVSVTAIAKDLWLSDSELKVLGEMEHCIGLHSYDHPFELAKLSYKQQSRQYTENYDHIRKICNKEIVSMSHPLNSYNHDTLKILTQLGITCGFRSNVMPPDGKNINPSLLEMAREDSANILKTISL